MDMAHPGEPSRSSGRAQASSSMKAPPGRRAERCSACSAPLKTPLRWRCRSETCDDLVFCEACGGRACPTCGEAEPYEDADAPLVLRQRVFREAYDADSTRVIDPRRLLARAFRAYFARPLLGERDGAWWSYGQCAAAARALADLLEPGILVIHGRNSAGWLVSFRRSLARSLALSSRRRRSPKSVEARALPREAVERCLPSSTDVRREVLSFFLHRSPTGPAR